MTRFAAIGGLTLAAICSAVSPAAAQGAADLDRLRQRALDLVNDARAEAGLTELTLGPALNDAAQSHAGDMAGRGYYAHVAPDGQTPRDRFVAAGGSRWALSGENIARCSGCAPPPDAGRVDAFQAGWMGSPGHRENILSDAFDHFGFGIARSADEIYAVQTFAGPGQQGDAVALGATQARAAALEAVNLHRETAGLAPLAQSDPLDVAAKRVLDMQLAGETLPEDIYGLLPEDATGWTSVSISTACRGGSGAVLTEGAVRALVEGWASARADVSHGGARASHLGFAAMTQDDGRATAVAVFGGRN